MLRGRRARRAPSLSLSLSLSLSVSLLLLCAQRNPVKTALRLVVFSPPDCFCRRPSLEGRTGSEPCRVSRSLALSRSLSLSLCPVHPARPEQPLLCRSPLANQAPLLPPLSLQLSPSISLCLCVSPPPSPVSHIARSTTHRSSMHSNCRHFRSPAGVIDSDNFRRRRADGQRPHPVAAHRGRPDAAPRISSRPTHLCAGMTAGVPDWWGAVGSALHTVSRRCSSVRHRRLWHGPALGAAVRA